MTFHQCHQSNRSRAKVGTRPLPPCFDVESSMDNGRLILLCSRDSPRRRGMAWPWALCEEPSSCWRRRAYRTPPWQRDVRTREALQGRRCCDSFASVLVTAKCPSPRILLRQSVAASPEVARRLGIGRAAPVLRLQRLRSLGGEPRLLEDMWLPLPTFAALLDVPLIRLGGSSVSTACRTLQRDGHPRHRRDHLRPTHASAGANARTAGRPSGRHRDPTGLTTLPDAAWRCASRAQMPLPFTTAWQLSEGGVAPSAGASSGRSARIRTSLELQWHEGLRQRRLRHLADRPAHPQRRDPRGSGQSGGALCSEFDRLLAHHLGRMHPPLTSACAGVDGVPRRTNFDATAVNHPVPSLRGIDRT